MVLQWTLLEAAFARWGGAGGRRPRGSCGAHATSGRERGQTCTTPRSRPASAGCTARAASTPRRWRSRARSPRRCYDVGAGEWAAWLDADLGWALLESGDGRLRSRCSPAARTRRRRSPPPTPAPAAQPAGVGPGVPRGIRSGAGGPWPRRGRAGRGRGPGGPGLAVRGPRLRRRGPRAARARRCRRGRGARRPLRGRRRRPAGARSPRRRAGRRPRPRRPGDDAAAHEALTHALGIAEATGLPAIAQDARAALS